MQTEYTVVTADYLPDLIERVNALLRDGWELVGSLVVTEYESGPDRDGYTRTIVDYYREMIRKRESA